MATITTISAEHAEDILEQSIVSGSVNAQGHLILTRGNGQTIDGGDFTANVQAIVTQAALDAVNAALPASVAGKFVAKGNITGAVTFTEFTKDSIINALIAAGLIGNITISTDALPANCRPGTQFAFKMQQDATGGRTLTLAGFKKSQGVLTLTQTANAIDIVVFMYDGTFWYAGLMGVDFK
jgi:hypothetical protein